MFLVERRKIDINGRVQIPSAMREGMSLGDGNEVVISYMNNKIEIVPAGSFKIENYAEGK